MPVHCSPETLTDLAKCFECLSAASRTQLQTYLLALLSGGSTEPQAVMDAAIPFQGVPLVILKQIQIYALNQIVATATGGTPASTQALATAATCFGCASGSRGESASTFLLCLWSQGQLPVPPTATERITEAGDTRTTEDGDIRIL